MSDHPDELRNPNNVCRPDWRNLNTAFEMLEGRRKTIGDHHAEISSISLSNVVPENVRLQFETTKNLYLYAWFVYRFYPVAQLHAYTCLELALRKRLGNELKKSEKRIYLSDLLRYAVQNGYLKNENFDVWQRITKIRAVERTQTELITEMDRLGLSEMEFDESRVVIKDEERDHDYVETLAKTIPEIRNHYAHGNPGLHNQVIGSLRNVQEIINQLWPSTANAG